MSDDDLGFAVAFQREIAGNDDVDVMAPEAVERIEEEYSIKLGVRRCRASVPCFIRDKAIVCDCISRIRKWVAFWRLVRFDLEDRLPTPFVKANSPQGPPLHRPIFTHVCAECGVRSDSYVWSYSHRIPQPALMTDGSWLNITVENPPNAMLEGSAPSTHSSLYVCSEECAQAINDYYYERTRANVEKLWADRSTLAGSRLAALGEAWGVWRRPAERRAAYLSRIEEKVYPLAERLVPPLEV
jgi:hypothetical protein